MLIHGGAESGSRKMLISIASDPGLTGTSNAKRFINTIPKIDYKNFINGWKNTANSEKK